VTALLRGRNPGPLPARGTAVFLGKNIDIHGKGRT
jgi:hypothetical protein